jgi:para-nitrobenzyl esterase
VNGTNRDEYALYHRHQRSRAPGGGLAAEQRSGQHQLLAAAAAYPADGSPADRGRRQRAADAVANYIRWPTTAAIRPAAEPGGERAGDRRGFACPALRTSQRALAQGTPIWMYEFRDQTARFPSSAWPTASTT